MCVSEAWTGKRPVGRVAKGAKCKRGRMKAEREITVRETARDN